MRECVLAVALLYLVYLFNLKFSLNNNLVIFASALNAFYHHHFRFHSMRPTLTTPTLTPIPLDIPCECENENKHTRTR